MPMNGRRRSPLGCILGCSGLAVAVIVALVAAAIVWFVVSGRTGIGDPGDEPPGDSMPWDSEDEGDPGSGDEDDPGSGDEDDPGSGNEDDTDDGGENEMLGDDSDD